MAFPLNHWRLNGGIMYLCCSPLYCFQEQIVFLYPATGQLSKEHNLHITPLPPTHPILKCYWPSAFWSYRTHLISTMPLQSSKSETGFALLYLLILTFCGFLACLSVQFCWYFFLLRFGHEHWQKSHRGDFRFFQGILSGAFRCQLDQILVMLTLKIH